MMMKCMIVLYKSLDGYYLKQFSRSLNWSVMDSILLILNVKYNIHITRYGGQFTFWWPIYIFNLLDITKLPCYPHRRSTTVCLETFTIYNIHSLVSIFSSNDPVKWAWFIWLGSLALEMYSYSNLFLYHKCLRFYLTAYSADLLNKLIVIRRLS